MQTTEHLWASKAKLQPISGANKARAPIDQRRFSALMCGLLLLAISTCNFLVRLNEPNQPFWDENYYLTATARYAQGRAQFASHPPLGLMFIAAGDALSGANHDVDVSDLARVKTVGDTRLPAHYQIWGPRLSSALFGVGVVMTVYGLLLACGVEVFLAAATATLVAFETAFVVQFRAAQLDAFQVEFALLCVGVLVAAARRQPSLARTGYFAVAGAAAGAAAMVKLDGVLLCAAPAALIGPVLMRRWRNPSSCSTAVLEGLTFIGAAFAIVCATYVAQTLWADAPLDYGAPAAAVDARFMSRTYQHYLDGRLAWSPKVVAAAAGDSLHYMLNDQAGISLSDPNGSSPWLQPFGVKPINYRWDSANGVTRYVQLVANPINWTISGLSLLAAAGALVARPFLGRNGITRATALSLAPIVSTALTFYVAHGLLGAHRVMYLYHAFITVLLGLFCLPFLVRELLRSRARWQGRIEAGSWSLIAASVAAFLWLSPLTYHRPLTHRACEWRNVPVHIVNCRD